MMGISQHPASKPIGPDAGCEHLVALRRDVALAVVISVLLLAGVAVGASLAARQEFLLTQPVQVPEPQPPELDCLPSGYVNQGVRSCEDVPAF